MRLQVHGLVASACFLAVAAAHRPASGVDPAVVREGVPGPQPSVVPSPSPSPPADAASRGGPRAASMDSPQDRIESLQGAVLFPEAIVIDPDPLAPLNQWLDGLAARATPLFGRDLDLQPEVTLVGQVASRTASGSQAQLGPRYQLDAAWTLWSDPSLGQAVVSGELRGARNIAAPQSLDLSANVGAEQIINNVWAPYEIGLRSLWWWVETPGGAVRADVGKLDPGDFFDTNNVANAETTQFIAASLTNNAAIPFPSSGLAAHVQVQNEALVLQLGVVDDEGNDTHAGFDTLADGNLLFMAELDLQATLQLKGTAQSGSYRFIVWGLTASSDPERERDEGVGLAVSFDQELPWGVAPFLRYGWAQSSASNDETLLFDWFVSAGVGVTPARRGDDMIGVGFGTGGSPLPGVGTQSLVEAFWRVQATRSLQVSPDLQLAWQPVTGDAPVVIPGVRVRWTF